MFRSLPTLSGLLRIQVIHTLIENSNQAILTLFLWRATSLQTVLQFRLIEVLAVPAMAFIGGFIVDRISPKLNFTLGVISMAVLLFAVVFLGEGVGPWIVPLAVISGVSSVQRFMSLNIINQQNITQEKQTSFFASLSISSKVIGIIFPFVSGLVITALGYSPIFGLSFVLSILMIFFCIRVRLVNTHTPYQPFRIYREWNREKLSLFLTNLLWGVEYGLLITILPITTTIFLKGESGWGIFTAILAVLGILYSFVLAKIKMTQANVSLLATFGFLLSMAALIFASTGSLITYILFMVLLQFWQSSQSVGLRPLLNKIIQSDPHISILSTEYHEFLEVPFFFGRLISLSVLLLLHGQLQSAPILGILFTILGLIPLYEAKSIQLSKAAFKKSYS